MPQFDVYRNGNCYSKDVYPYLMDVQADLLDGLQTRVIIPAARVPALTRNPIERLTPQLAGISRSELGALVVNATEYRDEIISDLDMLFTGI